MALASVRIKTSALVALLVVIAALPSNATQYYVDNTNKNASDVNAGTTQALPWKTIGKAAATAVAGDTITIVPSGIYDERVAPVNSGTSANPITFVAASGPRPRVRGWTLTGLSYVTVNGFEITNLGMSTDSLASVLVDGTIGVQILNNYIHDTSFVGIRSYSAKADHLHIQGNKTYHIGPSACRSPQIQLFAQNSLIENNDQSYGEDFNRVHGNHLVYRNNTLHDDYVSDAIGAPGCTGNGHLDGFQSFCAGTLNEAANYVLIEGNYYHDNPDNDEHFGLINGTDATNCTGVGAVVGSTTVIVRGNRIHGVGALSYVSDGNHNIAEQHKYYNNTTVSGAVGSPVHVTVDLTGTTQGSVLNNIFVDALQNAPPYQAYALKTGDSTSTGDYDLAFMSTGSVTWASPINAEPHHILNKNPLLTTTDSLQTGSPAIQAGGPLTTVATTDSGGGTLLVVADAHFFQDGWAGVSPDWIAVGSVTNVAQITSIDYSTNTISLTGAITRTAGQPVWLYKNSSGRRMLYDAAPDVGASPNPISPSPAPPTGPATIIF